MIKEVRIQTFGNLKIMIDGTLVYEAEPHAFIPKIWLLIVLIARS